MSVQDVLEFLRSRSLPNHILERIQEEKIDAEAVLGSDDQILAQFIPSLGDRIALKNFASSITKTTKTTETKRSRLFEILKGKIHTMDRTKQSLSKSNAQNEQVRKKTRKVDFGWIHKGRQVRKRLGGGCRKLDVDRNTARDQLLDIGKDLFFPGGLSTKGKVEEFDFDILDFKETALPSSATVNECYEVFKTGVLTFYIHSKDKEGIDGLTSKDVTKQRAAQGAGQAQGSSNQGESNDTTTTRALHTEALHGQPSWLSATTGPSTDTTDILGEAAASIGGFMDDDFDLPDINIGNIDFNVNVNLPISGESVMTGTEDVQSVEMTIHRGPLVLSEMCSYFKDASIMDRVINIVRILPNGDIERAQDTGGVLKDTLTVFWEQFYSQCTVGRDVKVPFLRHDYGQEEWNAVGRILVYRWKCQRYWPVKISHIFLHHCIFPQLPIPQDELLQSFYGFISAVDKDIFSKAVQKVSTY